MVLALFINFFLLGVRPAHADDANVRTSLSDDSGPDFRVDPTNHREARLGFEGEWYFNVVGIEPKLLDFFEVDPRFGSSLVRADFSGSNSNAK